jgi:YesN/AraC family two-component response regulator
VDDEAPAREELKFLLRPYPDLEVAGEAEDGVAALEKYRLLEPDVVFLDIQIPGIQGIDLAATFSQAGRAPADRLRHRLRFLRRARLRLNAWITS